MTGLFLDTILTQQYMQGKSATSLHSKKICEYHEGVSKAAFSFKLIQKLSIGLI
jgi:hypothetical protein